MTFCICRQAWNPRPGNTCPTGHKPQTLFEVAAADLWAGSDCTSCRRHQFPAKSAPTPPKMKSHQPAEQQLARACFRIRGALLESKCEASKPHDNRDYGTGCGRISRGAPSKACRVPRNTAGQHGGRSPAVPRTHSLSSPNPPKRGVP